MAQNIMSPIADRNVNFDRDINQRAAQTMEPGNKNMMNLLKTGNSQINALLGDRFEIESIRQE